MTRCVTCFATRRTGPSWGAVAWIVLTRAELTAYVQAFQRRAHAFRVIGCKRLILVTRYMKKHKCGFKSGCLKHKFKLVGFIDAAFEAQADEPTGLALRGVSATLQEDSPKNDQPYGAGGLPNLVDFTVRRQGRVTRSTFSANKMGWSIALNSYYCSR